MRSTSAEPDVRSAADASGTADMPAHAMAANMGREMRPATANMTREMRNACTAARRKVRSSTAHVRRKMRSAATDVRSTAAHMRSAATHVGCAAGVAAARVTAATRSWRREACAGRQTQGQADGGYADRNGSRRDHNVSCPNASVRACAR
jgi:hypothetical protein